VKNGVVSKYYFAGSTRLAVRTNGTLSYLLSDHLGSSSLTTDANGVTIGESLYKAFGESRYLTGTIKTDYKFTGQREESALGGIYFFQSRWFDPALGRFLSPDSIVPTGSQGTQAWDRYGFVNNNPVRYNDPTGHYIPVCNPMRNENCDVHKDSTSQANTESDNSNGSDDPESQDSSEPWDCKATLAVGSMDCSATLDGETAQALADTIFFNGVLLTGEITVLFGLATGGTPLGDGIGVVVGLLASKPYFDASNELYQAIDNTPSNGAVAINISRSSSSDQYTLFATGYKPVTINWDILQIIAGVVGRNNQ